MEQSFSALAATFTERIHFAADSPDFYRGLAIGFTALVVVWVIRDVVVALRSTTPRPFTDRRWAQVSGLLSYLCLALVAAGHQVSRLGEPMWSWRLVVTGLAAVFGLVWVLPQLPRPRRRRRDEQDQHV